MDPVEAQATLLALDAGSTAPFTHLEVGKAIHEEPRVFAHILKHIDQKTFTVACMLKLCDEIGKTALDKGNKEEAVAFIVEHGFSELYFYAAWALWRGGHLDRATESALAALQLNPELHIASKLLAMIASEQEADGAFPYTHKTMPPIETNYPACEIIWPEGMLNVDHGILTLNASDRWTN